jgi:hypothetical protein
MWSTNLQGSGWRTPSGFSVGQMSAANDGTGLVLAKLSEVLFIETLRRYIQSLPPEKIGCHVRWHQPVDQPTNFACLGC